MNPLENVEAFIQKHADDDLNKLLLQRDKYPNIDLSYVVQQIEGLQKAQEKLPHLLTKNKRFIFPPKESMEQCSSEQTAEYKASLVKGKRMVDLTGGLGIDTYFFSKQFDELVYVEQNQSLLEISRHNLHQLNRNNICFLNTTCEEYLQTEKKSFDCIFIDPSRRSTTKKRVFLLEDCEPNVLRLKNDLFALSPLVLLKTSPLLDIQQTIKVLGNISKVHVVSLKNECKELLFEWNREEQAGIRIISVELSPAHEPLLFEFDFFEEAETQTIPCTAIGKYLYEPYSCLLKAGAFKILTKRYPIKKLAKSTHLYTSDERIDNFPGRIISVFETQEFNKKSLKNRFSGCKGNVITRNFPLQVEDVKKTLGILDGGELFLYFCTLSNGKKICVSGMKT